MNQRRFRPDTVDRIRPCADIRIDGKVRFVIAVALAPTATRPARRALTVGDPADSMAQTGEVIYLDAGETVQQTWDPRIDRPTRDDLAQPAPVAVVAEVEREEYCGDPVDPACGPDLGKPWCHYHNGTSVNPYEYAA